jgi:hypothetical protein
MHRYAKLAIALVVAGGTALAGAPAQASGGGTQAVNVLTYGSLGGTNVAVGNVLTSGLKTGTVATFYSTTTGTTGVKCSVSAFSATVLTNPAAGGTATESLTSQTFGTCTSNVPGVTSVMSVVVNNLPYNASVNGTSKAVTITGGTAGVIQTTVKLGTLLGGITCVYLADLNTVKGLASNTDNSITFTNQKFNKSSGPATCFTTAWFSAVYAPVTDSSIAGSPSVFTQ